MKGKRFFPHLPHVCRIAPAACFFLDENCDLKYNGIKENTRKSA